MRAVLLDKVQETMKKSNFFRAIMPQKIFTDMYQFYMTVNQTQANISPEIIEMPSMI